MESTLSTLRAMTFEAARADLEADMRCGLPDPQYQEHMQRVLADIRAADTLDRLAAINWVQGIAEMGRDASRYDADIPNL